MGGSDLGLAWMSIPKAVASDLAHTGMSDCG